MHHCDSEPSGKRVTAQIYSLPPDLSLPIWARCTDDFPGIQAKPRAPDPGQVALYGRGVATSGVTWGGACGTRCGRLGGCWGRAPSCSMGEGVPRSQHWGGCPCLRAPSYCWMIPPSSAGETESRRGVRGERSRGFIHTGTWESHLHPGPALHPHPHPSAVSQRPAAPPRPTSSSPSPGGLGAVRRIRPSPPIPLQCWGTEGSPLNNPS